MGLRLSLRAWCKIIENATIRTDVRQMLMQKQLDELEARVRDNHIEMMEMLSNGLQKNKH